MGCSNCGSGCGTTPKGCKNNGNCGTSGCNKLDVFDWLVGMERLGGTPKTQWVEVRFKNTRKEFYLNTDHSLTQGDVVVVEASHGYDVGVVSLTGDLVIFQMDKKNVKPSSRDEKRVIRKATQEDIDLWHEARAMENETMVQARVIARKLKLSMKISDVEFQGDKQKATFYYLADERIDFRDLIRDLAKAFKVKVDMRQIGARQEAGRIGGIGPCGRELCCSTFLTDFRSVSTSAARYQQLSINPMKLAGQCGKLKCCLNYELDSYMDALKDFPNVKKPLETNKGKAFHMKTDIFKRMMWYTYADNPSDFIPVTVDKVKEIIEKNKAGKKVDSLKDFAVVETPQSEEIFGDVVGQESLTRFDKSKNKRKKKKRRNKQSNRNQGQRNEKK